MNVGAAVRLPKVKGTLAERILDIDAVLHMLALERNPRNKALLRLLYLGGLGMVQIRVTFKARNPCITRDLLTSGVTWDWHFLNHAEKVFRLSLPVRINGRDVACKASPSSAPSAPDTCPDWPANLAVGYTRVRVGYWEAALRDADRPVQVIAEITSLATSTALPGTTRVNLR